MKYAQFSVNNKTRLKHRAVWEKVNGPTPDDMRTDHFTNHGKKGPGR